MRLSCNKGHFHAFTVLSATKGVRASNEDQFRRSTDLSCGVLRDHVINGDRLAQANGLAVRRSTSRVLRIVGAKGVGRVVALRECVKYDAIRSTFCVCLGGLFLRVLTLTVRRHASYGNVARGTFDLFRRLTSYVRNSSRLVGTQAVSDPLSFGLILGAIRGDFDDRHVAVFCLRCKVVGVVGHVGLVLLSILAGRTREANVNVPQGSANVLRRHNGAFIIFRLMFRKTFRVALCTGRHLM